MRKQLTEDMALMRLEALCARSEQCTYDIIVKLKRWNIPSAISSRIISHLTSSGFVDDTRFAKAYVREKYMLLRWGRRKIKTGLFAKRIDSDIIESAMEEINIRQYASNAFKVISNKLGMLPAELDIQTKRQRLIRFGLSRGFETTLVLKIVNSDKLWDSCQK